ncbi:MAG: histidine--tRNA ligase [Prolixibacteraceae bacterium]|jgi:histidyl-tRNA synthetase|nr:histidine--tRNA ligase [Prolixibacteraceae bacterium]MDI9563056.1 histidine--tRNA ligase [Bacteroidota bacterium]NLS98825.1 histidine--tRNA ligase [Bacteroidales bacterium]OQB80652.1 MAG: Histidine--tRNA ligase [Bacteroidetes bacterium ADurb.Bin123]HNU78436.1 histidine--tRNA ligase [Prolixibacteraceae bacterium]
MTPSIPKGTRDFLPSEMFRRNFIFDVIRQVFHLYGFQPIETPAMENLSTLLGKYGEEGDKLLFRILNSGDFLSEIPDSLLQEKSSNAVAPFVAEKGLRYDLTVPFARFVVQHRNDILFPFRRYQIQPVWRADRPQKGRYREFYQCDCDVIGSDSLLNEAELVQIIDDIFSRFRIRTVTKINNRKVLAGIADVIGHPDRITDLTVAIDKMEKIGLERVKEELSEKGISGDSIEKLEPILMLKGTTHEKIDILKGVLSSSAAGLKGLEELEKLFGYISGFTLTNGVELDLTLARGLNYYTGAIFEVKSIDEAIGSVCGGGRYDDLTGVFGMPGISGVGISFGAERIYDVMTRLNLFPGESRLLTKVLFINFGSREEEYILPVIGALRRKGIHSEVYPEPDKMKKQMNYANRKEIPYVVLAGEEELRQQKFTLKDMRTGEQTPVTAGELIKILSE